MDDSNFDDPFGIFGNTEAPKEDDVHQIQPLFKELVGDDGKPRFEITPSPMARQSAAVIGGQFQAMLDITNGDGQKVFTRDEAIKILLHSMNAVIIHSGGDDDDEDD